MIRTLALIALAGCPAITGGSSSSGGGGTMPSGGASGGAPAGGESAGGAPSGDELVVPNLIGKSFDEAQAMAKQAGFQQDIESSHPVECGDSAPKDAGKINCQDPEPGKRVRRYTMIQVNVYQPQVIHGAIVRSQLEPLHGMKIDQAKAALAKLGFKGKVIIEHPQQFIASCKLETVCDVQPEAGIGMTEDDQVFFVVNESQLKISAPPP